MGNNAYEERTSNEKCPDCGRPILYGCIKGANREYRIECECERERRTQEHKHNIEQGKNLIRNQMRINAGLKKKQSKYFIKDINPKEGQDEAYNAVIDFIEQYISRSIASGIILSGGVGSGKTTFAAAIANAIIDEYAIDEERAAQAGRNREADSDCFTPVRFTSVADLFAGIRASYTSNSHTDNARVIVDRLKNTPLLILDDLAAERANEWNNTQLFEIIDHRYNQELPIIITTNALPIELKEKEGERIFDRLREMCIAVPMKAKSQRTTAKAIHKQNSLLTI